MIFKSDSSTTELNGFLDAGSHVKGDLRFENTFRIDGKLTGGIVSDGILMIGEGGELEGDIQAGQVFVSGRVEGKISAKVRVQIAATGVVTADLETPTLVIEDGAVFEGRCAMPGKGRSEEGRNTEKAVGPKAVAPTVPFAKDR